MTVQYTFSFDARYCSGCKACQAACKDKNNLPVGVLWRRVYEIAGGSWQRDGEAWSNTVFAYNLSMSCNHCEHPKCAGVCPVDAYDIRDDGIVILDTSKCVGCGYCAWACPYGAPQYNPQAGYMTKCDFCYDNLDQELPPACVAACPLRVLDYGDVESKEGLALWEVVPEKHPFPMPVYSHTQPHLAIQPHTAMQIPQEKFVANLEETQPRTPSVWEELPLIIFTLLGQLAVGGFWTISLLFPSLWLPALGHTGNMELIPYLIIGICLGMGMLASFAHLGTKKNAWRVLTHLRRSWLSREILFAGLFGLGWLVTAYEEVVHHQSIYELTAITAIFGIGLVYSMGQVYRIPAAPGWNTWRTNASFMISALLLGGSVMFPVAVHGTDMLNAQIDSVLWMVFSGSILIFLLIQLALMPKHSSESLYRNIRMGLIITGSGATIVNTLLLSSNVWPSVLIFLFVAIEEVLGRWLFYRSRLG